MAVTCVLHPNKRFLMDIAQCPSCRNNTLREEHQPKKLEEICCQRIINQLNFYNVERTISNLKIPNFIKIKLLQLCKK